MSDTEPATRWHRWWPARRPSSPCACSRCRGSGARPGRRWRRASCSSSPSGSSHGDVPEPGLPPPLRARQPVGARRGLQGVRRRRSRSSGSSASLQQLGVAFGVLVAAAAVGPAGRRAPAASIAAVIVVPPIGLTALAWVGGVALGLWCARAGRRCAAATAPHAIVGRRRGARPGCSAAPPCCTGPTSCSPSALARSCVGAGAATAAARRRLLARRRASASRRTSSTSRWPGPATSSRACSSSRCSTSAAGRAPPAAAVVEPLRRLPPAGRACSIEPPWPLPAPAGAGASSRSGSAAPRSPRSSRCSSPASARRAPRRPPPPRHGRLRRRPAAPGAPAGRLDPPRVGELRAARLPAGRRRRAARPRAPWPRAAPRSVAAATPVVLAARCSSPTSPAAPAATTSPRAFGLARRRRRSRSSTAAASSTTAARDAVAAVNELLPDVERRHRAGRHACSSAPATSARRPTARRSSTTCSPSSPPATRYIEMDPGVANADDSGLADELAAADVVDPVVDPRRLGRAERLARVSAPTSRTRCSTSEFCLGRLLRRGPVRPRPLRAVRRAASSVPRCHGGSDAAHRSRPVAIVPTYEEAENIERVPAPRSARPNPDVDVLVVDDTSPDGTADLARPRRRPSSAASTCRCGRRRTASATPTATACGIALDRGLRPHRPDGRRPLARPRRPPAAARRRSTTASTLVDRLALRARRLDPALAVAPPRALSKWGNRYTCWVLGMRVARHDRRASAPGGPTTHPAHRAARRPARRATCFQIETAYRVVAGTAMRHRRGADHVHRPRAGPLEDESASVIWEELSTSPGGASATACSAATAGRHVERSAQ